jgi:hypothetical protein
MSLYPLRDGTGNGVHGVKADLHLERLCETFGAAAKTNALKVLIEA